MFLTTPKERERPQISVPTDTALSPTCRAIGEASHPGPRLKTTLGRQRERALHVLEDAGLWRRQIRAMSHQGS